MQYSLIFSTLALFYDEMKKKFHVSLRLSGEATHLVVEDNFRKILDSKSEKFKNIEAHQKYRYPFQKKSEAAKRAINLQNALKIMSSETSANFGTQYVQNAVCLWQMNC